MSIKESVTLVAGAPVAAVKSRALIGWMVRDETVAVLLGGRFPAPGEDLSKQDEIIAQAKAKINERPEYKPEDCVVDTDHGFDLESFSSNQTIATHFFGLKWSIQVVDLTKILAYQKLVKIEGLVERVSPIISDRSDKEKLAKFCLPLDPPELPQGLIPDMDKHGFSVSSLNPNLRFAGAQVGTIAVAPQLGMPSVNMIGVTFLISMGASYMQAVRYNGRTFLRDGYHRAVSLLQNGITQVPCVFIEATSFEQVGADPASMLSHEILYGQYPPYLKDFIVDLVSTDVLQPSIRRVIHLRASEFNIQG